MAECTCANVPKFGSPTKGKGIIEWSCELHGPMQYRRPCSEPECDEYSFCKVHDDSLPPPAERKTSDGREFVHRAVDAHMKAGGCAAEGKVNDPCVACRAAYEWIFGSNDG